MNPCAETWWGMSTNREACYDKLDKAIVALLWLSDRTQSISLTAFFPPLLGQGFSHILSWQVLQSQWPPDLQSHIHPPSPSLPCPLHHHLYQRLSVICEQMKGKMWLWRERFRERKECLKPMKCEGSELKSWLNWEFRNQTKSLLRIVFLSNLWSTEDFDQILNQFTF